MIEELQTEIGKYWNKWEKLGIDHPFLVSVRPTSVAWKTKDLADFDVRFAELRELCDQVHVASINDRWIATMHLKPFELPHGLEVIKLMQRRPGSTDATGLDHLDFLIRGDGAIKKQLETSNLKWSEEMNGDHCKWLSIWFDGTEAKLRSNTVIETCIDELREVDRSLIDKNSE